MELTNWTVADRLAGKDPLWVRDAYAVGQGAHPSLELRDGVEVAVTGPRLSLTREQILAFRRRVGALEERLPAGRESLQRAVWAGLQGSMPRAALLWIHARVAHQSDDLGRPLTGPSVGSSL